MTYGDKDLGTDDTENLMEQIGESSINLADTSTSMNGTRRRIIKAIDARSSSPIVPVMMYRH